MAKLEVGVGAAADAAYNIKRKEEMAASEAAAEIQRMKRGYLIKVSGFKRAGFAMVLSHACTLQNSQMRAQSHHSDQVVKTDMLVTDNTLVT